MFDIKLFEAMVQAESEGNCPLGVIADYLDENNVFPEEAKLLRAGRDYVLLNVMEKHRDSVTPAMLRGGNWRNAFYEPGVGNEGELAIDRALPNDVDTSIAPFTRADVKRVIAYEEGENEEKDWLCVGELHDGRFFALASGCDYTGWG